MKYYKFFIDEQHQYRVFMQYRAQANNKKEPLVIRDFDLDLINKEEPAILEMVVGDVIGIYYEQTALSATGEKIYLDRREELSEEEIKQCISFVDRACVDREWDELLNQNSVDDQVEDFIKQFFEEEESPIEQKDFLAEFFAELDEESSDAEIN